MTWWEVFLPTGWFIKVVILSAVLGTILERLSNKPWNGWQIEFESDAILLALFYSLYVFVMGLFKLTQGYDRWRKRN